MLRLGLAIVLAGCWTGAPPPAPRSNRCEIRERLVETASPVRLGVHKQRFAAVTGPLVRIEIIVTAGEARALVETEEIELEGELELDELALRPKQIALHDGWLEIRHAIARAAYERNLRVEVGLPAGLNPRWTSIDLPCDALTLTAPPATSEPETGWIELPAGTSTTLFRAPGRDPLQTWTAPKRPAKDEDFEPLVARVIERRGRDLRVRIVDRNVVFAWVAASAVRELDDGNVYGGLVGGELGQTMGSLTCDRPTPIYVRADGKLVRVGRLKPDQELRARRTRKGEIELDLGGTDATPLLVRGTPGCTLQ